MTALALALLCLAAGGCQTDQQRWMTPERLDAGLVVSLDGVGGYDWGPRWIREGLDEAGVKSAIVIYDWSKGPAGLWVGDLVDESATASRPRTWPAWWPRTWRRSRAGP